jgi:hypothetical protein
LGNAVVIPQIDKQELAVVAFAMHPSRQPGWPTRIGKAERSAGMGPIGVHREEIRNYIQKAEHGMEELRLSSRSPCKGQGWLRPSGFDIQRN